jgi:hypothetical protein
MARGWVGVGVEQCPCLYRFIRLRGPGVITTWNENPRPYVWTKTADQILESIATYCTRINESGH